MPELPEVETIRQNLRRGSPEHPSILGRTIRGGQVQWERTLAIPTAAELSPRLAGQTLQEIDRRGKFLIFQFDRDHLLVHLRMSGDLLLEKLDTPPAAHHRLWLDFEPDLRLAFSDPRKFGRAWLVADPQDIVGGLGPEPLEDSFTAVALHRRLRERRRQLKPLLLDQTFLAGMGNIYTDEALHVAHLHPLMSSSQVDEMGAQRLWAAIRQVLQEGIRRNGASIDWVYRGGDFQNYFRAYQRTGQPCPDCGTPIERLVVGQRSTHVCPNCQRIETW